MSEELERLALKIESVGRRGFLDRVAAASLALVASVFGFAQRSEAVTACVCCNLCLSPGTCINCACSWSWTCCPNPPQAGDRRRICGECYQAGPPCTGACTTAIVCSFCRVTATQCPF